MGRRIILRLGIAISVIAQVLATIPLAFSLIPDELWAMRVIYLVFLVYLFGVVPLLCLWIERKERENVSRETS